MKNQHFSEISTCYLEWEMPTRGHAGQERRRAQRLVRRRRISPKIRRAQRELLSVPELLRDLRARTQVSGLENGGYIKDAFGTVLLYYFVYSR